MQEKIKHLLKNRTNAVLAGALVVLVLLGGFGIFQFIASKNANSGPPQEIELAFDPEGAYALMLPRKDGNAVNLQLKRTAGYDAISYELTYLAVPDDPSTAILDLSEDMSTGAIDRGVVGEIDTKDKKGEYEQEILFGTCSKNVCKYDKGVENGQLNLKVQKKNIIYKMNTQWHLQQPDVALGVITSGDNHFVYTTTASREDLALVGYTIVNELTGVPKLPDKKQVLGKVYALNVPVAKSFPAGNVVLELAENPPTDAKIYRYNEANNGWDELVTTVNGSKLSADAPAGGIFAILVNK